ncbi:XTP/dITP diphosphatase [Ketobacter sp. MCCC 1A13808]|uniref:XTP/dITP diphosphatase n=1 Tax=Ketobacter sp. MCCC 1A13808 TaxID=2602738 RepID=UPI000F1CB3B5|nr:XTP/dITP diphosphatase [Ketobacter sp. MCCC 1A13808]MVF13668.1 XTP/dITP diphosphatase [Ketobacter sp. MCCC 1A13808]RLP53168.1 MAG: XTP/dITP diphosphatase [Ketobacter sp.]
MQEIVVASGNRGKLKEISQMLSPLNIQVIGQKSLNIEDIEETGLSFVENAILKARNASRCSGRPALADDSGLEVDALNGEPGIYSARYAGEPANDANNIVKLLANLQSVAPAERTARFQCVMVYLRHDNDPTPIICQGTWEGLIVSQPQGENGFGYDPVFWVPGQECSAAQLPPEIKNKLSHRGQALQQMIATLAGKA